jgi:diguanylate cyclase (GGDEF)-like protein
VEGTSVSVERLLRRIERERRARLEAEAIAEQATRAALHDSLTGLPNRLLVLDRLTTALDRAARANSQVALFFVDLDRFKLINDSLGHGAGDRLLAEVARRLLGAARTVDTVGRFGGDEFVVLCEDVAGREAAVAIAERISAAVSPAFELDGAEVRVRASVGIALSTPGSTAEDLIRDCDAAMYHAKDNGRGRSEFFDESVRKRDRDRLRIESELLDAIENGGFELHYQPIVELPTMRVTGVEPLVRWRHPTRGLLPPADFIGHAEEAELIDEIDRWVLRSACEQVVAWQDRDGRAVGRLSVNFSARQLATPGLDRAVGAILRESGVSPANLILEITESVLVAESALASENLGSLHRSGVRIAIDDFGTGYCSLAYLRRFSVDALKIHQSFVSGLGKGAGGEDAILTAIVAMGRALGLTVVAEGVETSAQLERVAELGCHEVQGFLISPPLPAAEYESRFLAEAAARVA